MNNYQSLGTYPTTEQAEIAAQELRARGFNSRIASNNTVEFERSQIIPFNTPGVRHVSKNVFATDSSSETIYWLQDTTPNNEKILVRQASNIESDPQVSYLTQTRSRIRLAGADVNSFLLHTLAGKELQTVTEDHNTWVTSPIDMTDLQNLILNTGLDVVPVQEWR